MKWKLDKENKIISNSKIKGVVYSITNDNELFYVGLTRISNKQNKFLEKITGRVGRDLQIFVNGVPHYGSVIARCLTVDVAKQFVSNFENSIKDQGLKEK